jgi:hypothetical protein
MREIEAVPRNLKISFQYTGISTFQKEESSPSFFRNLDIT